MSHFSRLRFVWHYRELIRNLVARELKVRYRESVAGLAWSLLNPLLMMIVFTVVFTVLLRSAPANVPYPAFLLTAILAWNYFQMSVLAGMASIVGNAGLISKLYFPREVLPISAVLANTVNFIIALVLLLPVTILFGISPSWLWLYFPVILAAQLLFTLGVTLLVGATNVFFRDTQYIAEALLLAWFFLTPIFYDITQVFNDQSGGNLAGLVLILNPVASFVNDYRSIFLTHTAPDPAALIRSLCIGGVTAAVGYATFVRMARDFGDVL